MKVTRRERVGKWELEYTVETIAELTPSVTALQDLLRILDEHVLSEDPNNKADEHGRAAAAWQEIAKP